MTGLDFFLILIAVGIVILFASDGMLRALFMLFGFYIVTLAAGLLVVMTNVLSRVAISAVLALGGSMPNMLTVQSYIFLLLTAVFLVVFYAFMRILFPDMSMPKLGVMDNLLGALVGLVIALLFIALLYNTIGVLVGIPGHSAMWRSMRVAHYYSILRPYLNRVLYAYQRLLFPLRYMGGYPPFFVPQL